MRDNIKRLLQVLNELFETERNISDCIYEYKEFYCISTEMALLVFKTYKDACSDNLLKSALGIIYMDRKFTSLVVINKDAITKEYYHFRDDEVNFNSSKGIIHLDNISRDDYFNESLNHPFFIDYDEFQILSEFRDKPCTINIYNL